MSDPHDVVSAHESVPEIDVSPEEPDRERPFVTVWFVVVDGNLYVRNGAGYEGTSLWFRRALRLRRGRIRLAGTVLRASFAPVDPEDEVHAAIDATFTAKYGRTPAMIDPETRRRTLLVTPHLD